MGPTESKLGDVAHVCDQAAKSGPRVRPPAPGLRRGRLPQGQAPAGPRTGSAIDLEKTAESLQMGRWMLAPGLRRGRLLRSSL
jgi:hypothetical protein